MKNLLFWLLILMLSVQFNLNSQTEDVKKIETKNLSEKSDETKKTDEKTEDTKKTDDKKSEEPEKEKSPHTFTANVSLVSDYRFRGISQTMRRPAIQGGFDYAHAKGFYAGTWASNVDGTCQYCDNTSMEWDLYAGYKGKLLPCLYSDLAYTAGMIFYYYPGGKTYAARNVGYNTAEYLIELTYRWMDVKFYQTITNYFGINSFNPPYNWKHHHSDKPSGSSKGSIYVEGNLTLDVCEKLGLLLHVGHEHVRHYRHLSYTDWKVTLTRTFDWFNFFITYVGTDALRDYFDVPDHTFHPSVRNLGGQEILIGISRSF